MVIRLNQKNCKKLIYFQLIFVLCVYFFISIFHFPSMLTYVTDVVNIILLFCMFRIKSINLNCVGGKYIKISIGLFLGSLVIGCILNLVSPILIIWGARNLLRGFVFFVAYNYRWFAHEMIYLQNGIVGIILFINYFIQIFIHAFKKKRIFYNDKKVINYATITQIFSILVIVNIWYNQTITTDFQYLIYVVLASFLIQFKTKKYSENA